MTGAACRPLPALMATADREGRPDRFVELLECLADLIVETAHERQAIERSALSDDPRAPEAARRLAAVEGSLIGVSTEAASVHQLLQHIRLI